MVIKRLGLGLAFLSVQLPAQAEDIRQLIDDLSAMDGRARSAARMRLIKIGKAAFPQLLRAVQKRAVPIALGSADVLAHIEFNREHAGDVFVSIISDSSRQTNLREGLVGPLSACMAGSDKLTNTVLTRINVAKGDGLRDLILACGQVGHSKRTVALLGFLRCESCLRADTRVLKRFVLIG